MAEPDFEAQLSRMFAEPPSFPDATLFNAEVASGIPAARWAEPFARLAARVEAVRPEVPIALAFDMVTYPLSQFERIQSYTPAMEALFAADTEAEAEEESAEANDADGDKGKANGSSSAKGVAVAASVGVVAATTGESSDGKTGTQDGEASQQASM